MACQEWERDSSGKRNACKPKMKEKKIIILEKTKSEKGISGYWKTYRIFHEAIQANLFAI